MFDLIKQLTEIPGMIGSEDAVQNFLMERWLPGCKSVKKTGIGNLIAEVGGKGPKLLIEAHADEIGVLVKGFSPEGMIWVAPKNAKAGIPGKDLHLLGQPCLIQSEKKLIEGIFATPSGHNIPDDLRIKNPIGWNDFFVDIGARNIEEAKEMGVQTGDTIVWNPPTKRLGNYITGKAMDDRVGLAIMTRLLETIDIDTLKFELHFASTVQEEIGLVGAHSLSRDMGYDYCLALDVGLTGDIPLVDKRDIECRLGGGPTIVHHDGTVHYDTHLTRHTIKVAKQNNIPVQHAVFSKYSSDGHALTMAGTPTVLIAFPTRYTHSPYEMISEQDIKECVRLISAFLKTPLENNI